MLVETVGQLRTGRKNKNLYEDDPDDYSGKKVPKYKESCFYIYRTSLIFFSTIFFLMLIVYFTTKSSGNSSITHSVIGKVPVEEWNHQMTKENFARDVAKSGIPVLLKNAPIQDWKALQWNPEYIKKRIQILDRVAVQDVSNVFVYEERYRPMAGLKKVLRKSVKKWKNMLTEDFFSEAKNSKSHFYYS